MKLVTFSILTVLSLVFTGLTLAESAMYQAWDRALLQQKDIQNKMAYFQRLNSFTEQVLRRMAVDSQHDPAIAELLKQRKIKVVVNSSQSTKETPGAAASPEAVPETTPAPTPSTSSHP